MPSCLKAYFLESKTTFTVRDKMKFHPYSHSLCERNAFYFVPITRAF